MKLLIAAEVFLSKNKYTCCRCYGFVGIAHARVATSDKGIFYATVKRRLETEACADLTILIVNLWKSCFQCPSLFLQHFLLCFNDLQFLILFSICLSVMMKSLLIRPSPGRLSSI